MATISLYASKINNMPGLIKDVKKSVTDYKSELSNLKKKSLQVNKSICNLDDVISAISTSTQTQEEKVESLETFQANSEQFIEDTVRIDSDVADLINQRKEEFYNEYSYLKPDSEKNGWEKFCDGVKSVGEWCKDNWQSIVKIVVAVVIIAALGIASVLTGGTLAVILAGAFWGALIGGALGGIMGGVTSVINGGSFLEGFADGLLSGTVSGAITGAACAGIGLAGQAFGKGVSCLSRLGSVLKTTSQVTRVVSLGMDGFDMLAMGIGLFDPNNPLVQINQKLHSSVIYNGLQLSVNALAIFTGAATTTMKCFVAGTMILTATGLVAIEHIKAGNKVISTNPETFEVAEKTVLETYVRETTELVHLTINGELIKTTHDHPFYVKDVGFVSAGELYIGDKLLDSNGNMLLVEDREIENLDEPVKVYNFQVEDFHTYHIGENGILVHNADYDKTVLMELKNLDDFDNSAVDHIFNGQINKRGVATGYHYEGIKGSSGSIVSGTKSFPNNVGVYEGKITVNGVDKLSNNGKSTFFPESMTPQEVINSINEAYAGKVILSKSGGNTLYSGVSRNGMKIKMWVNDASGKIVSAYPVK